MNKIIKIILGTILTTIFVCAMVGFILTPEKTPEGYYTDVIQYWTSSEYRCGYFNIDCDEAFKGCTTDADCEECQD